MSYIQIIRDSLENINTSQSIDFFNLNLFQISKISVIFFIENIKLLFFNFFSLNWLNFFVQLPIYIPQINDSILREKFFFDTFDSITISSQGYLLNTNKFFIGFLNGLFLSLPFSCSNLIIIRRYLIQGKWAGLAAILGNSFGQIFFLALILFGLREIIFSFFAIQPILFLIGIFLLLNTIYLMINDKGFKQINLSNTSSLLKIFLLSFSLIWIEQGSIYQFLGNINFSSEPTAIEGFLSSSEKTFFLIHLSYLLGIFFGTLFFNYFFLLLLENIFEYFQFRFKILRSSFLVTSNFLLLSSILTLSFSSIPYYGFDYLITSPLGFIPQDKTFKNTLFSQNNIKDSIGMFGFYTLNIDASTYGRGLYFKEPNLESFEELNYSGEYANFIQRGYIPLFSQYKKQAQKLTEFIIQRKTDTITNNDSLTKEKEIFLDDDFFKYPTFYLMDKNFNPSLFLERRYNWNYKNLKNLTFSVILERSLNRLYFRDDFFISSPKKSKIIKQKFYSNPIYKFLLNIDIDFFLKRDQKNFLPFDEKKLHIKRLILNRYNDTLRFYNLLPYATEFQYFFNGSKSFSDRIYNQQYKGTLKIVRRLFSISYFSKNLKNTNLILKYDQPLFLEESENNNFNHEELLKKNATSKIFMELTNQSPFYIGWDQNQKKIILTNRILPKNKSIYENRYRKDEIIKFSTWPLKENKGLETNKFLFEDLNTLQKKNYDLSPLLEYFDPYTGIGYYKTLPSTLNNIFSAGVDIFPPNRSGFIWPGQSIIK